MHPQILFDVSRLLSRAQRAVPSGIDRVELAYARRLIATARDRLSFAAMSKWGRFGPLPTASAIRLVETLGTLWRGDGDDRAARRDIAAITRHLRLSLLLRGESALYGSARRSGKQAVYLLVSHHHLDRPAQLQRLKRRAGVTFICFVHDLIPIEFPEYARPGQAKRHQRRMETVARLADAVIVNSASTSAAFRPLLERANRTPPVLIAPLGVDLAPAALSAPASSQPPYFVCVGTIEPKKNHLLLLNLWRRLAIEQGGRAPRLVLIGQRGWENENVIDMIERSLPLRGLIEEHNALSDVMVTCLLRGARALLLPSFAEGYGLPVAEALALGVPVLCSDLPALRAVGKNVPEYLDPLDGLAWREAVLDYAQETSLRRRAQMTRLSKWKPPSWEDHFDAVDTLIDDTFDLSQS